MPINLFGNKKGIGLVETILALGISIVVITSLVSLSLYSLRISQASKFQLQGTKLASEELERLRAARDSMSWLEFITALSPCINGNLCNIGSGLSIAQGAESIPISGTSSVVTRSFTVTDPINGSFEGNEQVLRFSVVVTWTLGTAQKYARIYTDLSNWGSN